MTDGLDVRLSTMGLAARYNVHTKSVEAWRRWAGFPVDAAVKVGGMLLWDPAPVDEWLRARPIHKEGRPPKWASVVHTTI